MPEGDVSGSLGPEEVAGGWECVQRLDELSLLGVDDMWDEWDELSKLEAGETVAEVDGPSKLYLEGSGSELGRLMVELGEVELEPAATAWESEQS